MGQLIVIAGPTASGKTALSLDLASTLNAEIISADARQFYRGMDIGTAKPSAQEQALVPHHFIDILNPDEAYTAGRFEQEVLEFLLDYFKTREVAIMVGGSGLYIKAVMDGFDTLPSTPPSVRERWNQVPLETLQDKLKANDPIYAAQVDMANRQRIQRALEAMELSGMPFSTLRKQHKADRPFKSLGILLNPPRQTLYDRINLRADEMMKAGLLDEVRSLLPYRQENALQTVGYKELFSYIDGEMKLEEAVEKIKQHTRNYAKRQFTWFRKQDGFTSFENPDLLEVQRHLRKQTNV